MNLPRRVGSPPDKPAIEIIDARIEQFDRHTKAMRRVQDTISDNAAKRWHCAGRVQNAST